MPLRLVRTAAITDCPIDPVSHLSRTWVRILGDQDWRSVIALKPSAEAGPFPEEEIPGRSEAKDRKSAAAPGRERVSCSRPSLGERLLVREALRDLDNVIEGLRCMPNHHVMIAQAELVRVELMERGK
jgi:hypothetical protein